MSDSFVLDDSRPGKLVARLLRALCGQWRLGIRWTWSLL